MSALGQVRRNGRSGGKSSKVDKKLWPRSSRKASARLEDAPAPAMMALPRIPSGVPVELVHPVNSQRSAKIALALLDAGLMSEEDTRDGNHPVALIENSFKRWFERVSAPLSIFDLRLDLTDSIENWDSGLGDADARREFKLGEGETVSFGVSSGEWDRFFLKDKVEAIERIAPGLGKTAIEKLEAVLYSSMFAVTPGFIEDAARYAYWGGCDNEDEFLEDNCVDAGEEELEAMKEDMVTRAEVDVLLPSLETAVLGDDEISALVTSDDALVASVAVLLLEKDNGEGYNTPLHADQIHQDGSTCTDAGVWLQWQPDVLTGRIADDWYSYASECSCCSISVLWMCELTSDKVADCLKNIERFIERLVWAEQLLSLIGTKEEG